MFCLFCNTDCVSVFLCVKIFPSKPNPTPVEAGVRFFQAQDQPIVTTQFHVDNRVFSHSLDVVSKMYLIYLTLPIDLCLYMGFLISWRIVCSRASRPGE